MYEGQRRWVRVEGLGCAVVAAFLAVTLAGAAAIAATSARAGRVQEPAATLPVSARHSIGIAFYYDFTKTPACSAVVTKNCVAKFEVLDISVPGLQHLLFTMPVPPGAMGKHFPVQGDESDAKVCDREASIGSVCDYAGEFEVGSGVVPDDCDDWGDAVGVRWWGGRKAKRGPSLRSG